MRVSNKSQAPRELVLVLALWLICCVGWSKSHGSLKDFPCYLEIINFVFIFLDVLLCQDWLLIVGSC